MYEVLEWRVVGNGFMVAKDILGVCWASVIIF